MLQRCLALFAHNKFAVAWKDMRKKEPNIYWSISNNPKFKREAMVHSTAKGEQDHPSLAIDRSGSVWVAWEDTRTGKRAIRIRSDREDGAELAIMVRRTNPRATQLLPAAETRQLLF